MRRMGGSPSISDNGRRNEFPVISDARHSTLARAFQQSGTDKFCSGVLNIPFAVHIRRKIILSRRRQARRPEILCASVLAEISFCSLQLLFGWWSSSEDETSW
jgi:hypothetical protein